MTFEKLHKLRVIVPLVGVNGLRNRTVIGALAIEYVHLSVKNAPCVPHEWERTRYHISREYPDKQTKVQERP